MKICLIFCAHVCQSRETFEKSKIIPQRESCFLPRICSYIGKYESVNLLHVICRHLEFSVGEFVELDPNLDYFR